MGWMLSFIGVCNISKRVNMWAVVRDMEWLRSEPDAEGKKESLDFSTDFIHVWSFYPPKTSCIGGRSGKGGGAIKALSCLFSVDKLVNINMDVHFVPILIN